MNVNTSDEDTLLLNIGFASGDLSYSLLVLVPGPTGTGTYHFADLDNIVFLWENGAGTCTDMTLTISELGELLYSPFLPAGNMYYSRVAGSFSGSFAVNGNFTGNFCAEVHEE